VEQFLKGVEANSRRELYYWHAYYVSSLYHFVSPFLLVFRPSGVFRLASVLQDQVQVVMPTCQQTENKRGLCLQDKRLPTGTTALLKLEGKMDKHSNRIIIYSYTHIKILQFIEATMFSIIYITQYPNGNFCSKHLDSS